MNEEQENGFREGVCYALAVIAQTGGLLEEAKDQNDGELRYSIGPLLFAFEQLYDRIYHLAECSSCRKNLDHLAEIIKNGAPVDENQLN